MGNRLGLEWCAGAGMPTAPQRIIVGERKPALSDRVFLLSTERKDKVSRVSLEQTLWAARIVTAPRGTGHAPGAPSNDLRPGVFKKGSGVITSKTA